MSVKKADKIKLLIEKSAETIKKAQRPPKPEDKRVRVEGDKTGNATRRVLQTNTDQDVTDMKNAIDKAAKRSDVDRSSIKLKSDEKFGPCFKAIMGMRYNALCLRCSGAA